MCFRQMPAWLPVVPVLLLLVFAATTAPADPGPGLRKGIAMESVNGIVPKNLKPGGVEDNTAAIQAAIDKATETGGTVCLPAGEFLITGNLVLKESVALEGVNAGPVSIGQRKGTILLPTAGRGDEDAPPFIHMTHATAVRRLTIYYPEQKCEDIVPYPWTFQMEGFDTTVEEVTLINSYNGIRTGPGANVRHHVRNVVGATLRRGIFVDRCTDIGRIENVQLHCHWWSDPAFEGKWDPVYEYMWKNLEAFVFARTDWEYMTNNFVFPANIGWRFISGEMGAANGHMTGCGADSTQTALQIDALQPQGLLVTGGQFVAFMGDEPVQLRVSDSAAASVRLVNCAFWGPARHNAVIGGTGYVSFSDCYFSNWKEDSEEWPLVVAKSGRVQVQNSTFATAHPSVELGPDVKHAIIRGNNGMTGVRVINNARKAIIADNEEDPVDWPDSSRDHFRVHIGLPEAARYLAGWYGSDPGNEWTDGGGPKRWSQPEAFITLPVKAGTEYTVLLDAQVPEHAADPGNGLYLGDTLVVPLDKPFTGITTGILPAQDGTEVRLRFKVKGWIPSETIAGSTDTRTLGIGARSITLRAKGGDLGQVYDAVTGDWAEKFEPNVIE
jgi:hypothetical protein